MRNSLLALALFAVAAPFIGCNDANDKVQGVVTISQDLAGQVSPTAVLYIVARAPGITSGPPLAVKRYTQPIHFPVEFSLSGQDSMIPDHPFKGKVTVKARISQSGSAIPVNSGDLEASTPPQEVEVGSDARVSIEINQKHP